MTVSAIGSADNNHRTCLIPMAEGALVGAGVGMALKYGYPLNKDEKNTNEYLSVMNDIKSKKTTYSAWTHSMLDDISKKNQRSLAEDVFVKTYEGLKYGDKVSGEGRIHKAFRTVKEQKPELLPELKRLFLDARLQAEKIAKKHVEIYNLATKHIRPTGFFVTAGAITGAVVAMVHEVLRTEVQ